MNLPLNKKAKKGRKPNRTTALQRDLPSNTLIPDTQLLVEEEESPAEPARKKSNHRRRVA